LNKNDATNKLEILKDRAKLLVKLESGNQSFKKWHRDTEIAIEKIFGEGTRHYKDFNNISYSLSCFTSNTPDSAFEDAYKSGVQTAITTIESFIDEINEYWDDCNQSEELEEDAINKIKLIVKRFHQVSRQLRTRYSSRPTIEIEDEYDVQDLFHALLRLFFDDVRAEEYSPSYAGSASRVDFLLKQEQIVIEIKKTRKNLTAKEVGEQLIIDSQRYQAHPNCSQLICFVYDPEGRIANPRGIEMDLTKEINGIPISVYITPE
jgi:hypothetical protein